MAENSDIIKIDADTPSSIESVVTTLKNLEAAMDAAAGRKLGAEATVIVTNLHMGIIFTPRSALAQDAARIVDDLMQRPEVAAGLYPDAVVRQVAGRLATLANGLAKRASAVQWNGPQGDTKVTTVRAATLRSIARGDSLRLVHSTEEFWTPILKAGRASDEDAAETVRIEFGANVYEVGLGTDARDSALGCLQRKQWAEVTMDAAYRHMGSGHLKFDAKASRLVSVIPIDYLPKPLDEWMPPFRLSHAEVTAMVEELSE